MDNNTAGEIGATISVDSAGWGPLGAQHESTELPCLCQCLWRQCWHLTCWWLKLGEGSGWENHGWRGGASLVRMCQCDWGSRPEEMALF